MNFETLAIHAGQEPDPVTGAVVTPIYQTSTYKQDGVGGTRGGYEYSRTRNPTRTALEECLAALENGGQAFAFASGMAAEDCLLRTLCQPGDHVLIPADAYGGTYRLFARVLSRWGITSDAVPQTDLDAVRAALGARKTRLVWAETPTNPLLSIVDLRALAEAAHEAGALLVTDNTFASPYLQRPLELGADAVVHSTTKYLGGHSDVVGGAVILRDAAHADDLAFTQNATGGGRRPVRRLAHAARAEDARGADGQALRERGTGGGDARGPPRRARGLLPRAARAPRAQAGGRADARLRRDGVVPARGGRPGRPSTSAAGPGCSPSGSRSAAWSRWSSTRHG